MISSFPQSAIRRPSTPFPLQHERNDALHALLVRSILIRELLEHELFFFAKLDPKAREREQDGDKSEQDLSEEYPVEEMEALGNRKKSANQVRLPQ